MAVAFSFPKRSFLVCVYQTLTSGVDLNLSYTLRPETSLERSGLMRVPASFRPKIASSLAFLPETPWVPRYRMSYRLLNAPPYFIPPTVPTRCSFYHLNSGWC